MKKFLLIVAQTFTSIALLSQSGQESFSSDSLRISVTAESKVLSGKLLETIRNYEETPVGQLKTGKVISSKVILYFEGTLANDQIQKLENLGATLFLETWTPPLENHKYGFLIASVPVVNLPDLLNLPFLKKIDTAERSSTALNNTATQSIRAPMIWEQGITGKGVKIGILDSGIDLSYAGTDLPSSFQYKDYSDYPNLDDNVANTVTGHGTHVAATALGRGVLSVGQTNPNNGKGSFKGSAPGADLVFLKIGKDSDALATDESVIAAIGAAVDIYKVDILSMSYGGWDDYHDGSSALTQKVDWAFNQGVPFFCSAGNRAAYKKHFSGTLSPNATSDFIEVIVKAAGSNDTKLRFNLVWSDGSNRHDLTVKYYNSVKELISDVTILPTTESLRGTESKYSFSNSFLPPGDGVYYLKIINNSSATQKFHIYEDWSNLQEGTDYVRFSQADPNFTIGSPSLADHAFSVGAYVSKTLWTDNTGKSRWWGQQYVYDNIAPFSSLGPTLDGRIKPDICAPGHVLLSLRDQDVYVTPNSQWIDNDGIVGGDSDYFAMSGTSMACPVVSGAAALYLENFPDASPGQVYSALSKFSNQSGLSGLPDNTWGSGKLDIFSAINGKQDDILVDGNIIDEKYRTLAEFSSGRNGYGDKNSLGALKYHSDGRNLYFGITGEVKGNDNILLFFDFSGVQGRGSKTLGGGNSGDFVYSAFSYLTNVTMDLDADFALGFNKGNSTQYEFFTDAIRYGNSNTCANIGKTNQMGANSDYDIGPAFGGSGYITIAYDSSFSSNHNKGVEVKIPVTAFAGVDISQTLRIFAVIVSMAGDVSNECIPGDPGPDNLGDGADFSVIPDQDFFTRPFKISAPKATTFVLSNEAPGFLIDKLILAGYGNSSLYEVLVALKQASGGVISQEFLDKLANCPAGSEVKTVALNNFAGLNNPVCANSDGTLMITGIYGADFYNQPGYDTYLSNQAGVGQELFTHATGPSYYINTGVAIPDGTASYQVFAIAWSNPVVGIPVAETNQRAPYAYPNPFTDGFYVHNLPENVRLEIFDIRGKLVYQTELKHSNKVYPGKLPDGIYFLKLTNSQGAQYLKIVKY